MSYGWNDHKPFFSRKVLSNAVILVYWLSRLVKKQKSYGILKMTKIAMTSYIRFFFSTNILLFIFNKVGGSGVLINPYYRRNHYLLLKYCWDQPLLKNSIKLWPKSTTTSQWFFNLGSLLIETLRILNIGRKRVDKL